MRLTGAFFVCAAFVGERNKARLSLYFEGLCLICTKNPSLFLLSRGFTADRADVTII